MVRAFILEFEMRTLRVRIVFFVAKLMGVPVKVRESFYGARMGCFQASDHVIG